MWDAIVAAVTLAVAIVVSGLVRKPTSQCEVVVEKYKVDWPKVLILLLAFSLIIGISYIFPSLF